MNNENRKAFRCFFILCKSLSLGLQAMLLQTSLYMSTPSMPDTWAGCPYAQEAFVISLPFAFHSHLPPNLLYIRAASKEEETEDISVVVLYSGQR